MYKWEIDDLKSQIGLIIKLNRLRKQMSQLELGNEVDLSKTHISRIENGDTNLTIGTIINICNYLEIECSSLFIKLNPTDLSKTKNEISILEKEFKNQNKRKT